ncbi:MAG TPA: tetratricopeptide repeat protein [Blastocatellia bacterium]|nr:tetratricopeptide repeat protein [Blastocatellia bacterium]
MLNRTRLLLTVFSAICLSHYASAQQLAPGGAPSADEVAVRTLVVKYFDAYAKKDLDAITSLWGKDAPWLVSRRDMLQRMFAIEDYRFSEPTISRIKIDGGKASARVIVERNATRVRGLSTSNIKSMVRSDLSFVNENGEWKLWNEAPAVASLASALGAAKTEAEREALLAGDQELMNRELLMLLNNQSDRAYAQADYSRALSILTSQRLVAEKLGEKREISSAWMNIGVIHFMQKRYPQALDAYQKGLTIEEELGRKSESASFLTSIGLVHSSLGKPKEAIEYLQHGLAIHEELNEKTAAAQALENIGGIHYEQGDYALASDFYQRSLKWLESKTEYAGRLLKIAKTEYEQGNDEAAVGFYTEAARRLESAGDKRSIGYTMHNIANIFYSQGDYAQAMNFYRRCLSAEREAGTRQGEAGALQGIGLIHMLDGNHALALEVYRENLKVAESLTDKANVAAAWQKVGNAHFNLNQFDQALEDFKQALSLREQLGDVQETASALIDLGVTYASMADFTNALDAYQKSKALYESANLRLGVAAVLLNESLISYAQKDYAKTIEQADQAAAISKQFGDSDLFWQARYRTGKAHYRSEKLDLARPAFVEAIATIETLRPQQKRGTEPRFYESKLAPYQAMVDVAISEGKGNEAFDYAERAKSRVLTGVLQSAKLWINKNMTPREREQEQKFLTDIAAFTTKIQRERQRQIPNTVRLADLTSKLSKTQKGYAVFRDKLFALRPQLKTLRGEGKPLDAMRAAALVTDTETALLDFLETEESVYLFAFTKTGGRARSRQPVSPLKIYILATNRGDLYARMSKFQDAIAGRSADTQSQARDLYDLMLKPAQEQLAGRNHLVIAPDAVSWNLPFQALRTEDDRYLIENYAVSYAPSLTALGAISRLRARPSPRATASPSLLALVNPALGPATEARLGSIIPSKAAEQTGQSPAAQNEVDELNKLYGERRVTVLAGAGASEDRMKTEARKYELIHLNVRGALNETAPLFSFSALSSNAEEKEDGVLEVREIFDLDLKSDLVVAPASELAWPTAGAIRSLTGLTWAWFVAGCPAIVVSRWRGDDPLDLMLEFHRRVKTSWRKESKARSWQAAVQQLLSREERSHPYFWAGFSVLGDAR